MTNHVNNILSMPEQLNMASYFLDYNLSHGRGNNIAVYSKGKSYTYNEICVLTNKTGNVLKELGVEIENRVYLVVRDSVELMASFYGTIKIGGIATLGYTYFSVDDYAHELDLIRPKVAVADDTTIDNLRKAAEVSKYPKTFLVVGKSPDELREREYDFESMVKRADGSLEAEPTNKNDTAFWKFSGGTTGGRKAIPHFHHDSVVVFNNYNQIMNYSQDDVVLAVPKMFFDYAREATMVLPLRAGAASVLFPERTTAKKIFELVEQYKPTILINVPTMIRRMVETPDEERTDLSSVRLCISAGEPLPSALYYKWKETFGCELIDAIGSGEVNFFYISNVPSDVAPGTLGKPVPGYEVKIIDGENHEVPNGEIGTLIVKGDSSAIQYVYEHEKSKRTFRGEWVYTDDLFFKDKAGNFCYAGRSDDLIKVSGVFVSPWEIEECIQSHPDVLECAVVGITDTDGLEKSKAFVVLQKGVSRSESKANEIKKFVKSKLSSYKYPRLLQFLDELPKTAVGKTDRGSLKQRRP